MLITQGDDLLSFSTTLCNNEAPQANLEASVTSCIETVVVRSGGNHERPTTYVRKASQYCLKQTKLVLLSFTEVLGDQPTLLFKS